MKRIILAALILFTSNAFAQTWVQVPDVNFQNYLTAHYPAGAFMTSGSDFFVDSDHAEIQATTFLDISSNAIVDIEGIQVFENLTDLDCRHNQLTILPDDLPNTLLALLCSYNPLTYLPDLPSSLIYLWCDNANLTSLPDLPNSLQVLLCSNNQLTVLPNLPNSLTGLLCGQNQLTSLPTLPSGMQNIDCSENQLTLLPDLPDSLLSFSCGVNLITQIPDLSLNMYLLNCNTNYLTSLPSLPEGLTFLNCAANQITALPVLPGMMEQLYAHSNQIDCFGEFPATLQSINIGANLYTCLPNYVSAMDAGTLAYPLCYANDPINNPNGCESASGIQGSVFNDVNNDCVDSGLPLIYVPMILNDDNGTLLTSSTNLVNGDYYFAAGPGDYAVEVNTITLSPAVQVNCPVANELTATVTVADPVVNAGDFGLACAGFDLGVQSVLPTGWFFPGQTHSLNIIAGDLTAQYNMHCATGISGDVTISVAGPGSVTFGGTPTSVSGNTATYSLSDFGALDANLFSASVLTDSTANAGDEFCVSVTVTTAASGDLNSANNTYNFCYPVVNSYDPNIKLTTPELVDPGYEDEFTYTIYFQNTGNAPAFNIRLADTLDQNLDLSTLKFVNGSHAFTTSLNADSRLLSIRFPNIMLPDSTTDAEGSIGFIQYRAKPISGLPNGTIIRNTAYIYFDFNAPIVTNTSENWFSSVGLNELTETDVKVYPNPATTTVVFESDEAIEQLEFYDLNGTKVKALQPKVQKTQVDVSYLQNGVYIVKVYSETGVTNKRLVVNQ